MYCCIDDNNTEIINNIVYMDLKKITYYINCVSDGFGFFGSKFEKLINDIDFENLPSNIQELNIIIINNNYLQHFSRVYKILVEKIKNVSNYVNIKSNPTTLPKRKFCSICGNSARYTCPRCGEYYCSSRCN